MGNEIVKANGFDMQPETFEDAWRMCKALASSELVPKDYRNKPENVLVAAQMGAELGLKPLQAIQNVAVINGRPAVWGDALLAIVRGHPECEDVEEWIEGEGDAMVAQCVVKRRGQSATQASFSVADAKAASLWKKQGPWQQYPKRMLQLRARSFALRDSFADALRGIQVAEEVRDYQPAATIVTAEFGDAPEAKKTSGTAALLERHTEAAAPKPTPAQLMGQIAAADTVVDLKAVARRIKDAGLPEEDAGALRTAYTARMDELTTPPAPEEPEPPAAEEPVDEERQIQQGYLQAIVDAIGPEEVYSAVQDAQKVLSKDAMRIVNSAAQARLEELG